jgi:dolichol kinase
MPTIPNVDVTIGWFIPPIVLLLAVGIAVLVSHSIFSRSKRLFEVSRKIVHVVTGAAFAIGSYSMTREQILLSCAAMGAGLVASSALRLPLVMERVPRITIGSAAFPLGLAISAVLFYGNPEAFRFSVLALGVCDAAAALVGTYIPLGGFNVLGQRKSLSGMIGCFVAALSLALIFGINPFGAIALAAAIMLVEATFVFGLDNLFVPIVAGLLYVAL